jgi:hypothetical protein
MPRPGASVTVISVSLQMTPHRPDHDVLDRFVGAQSLVERRFQRRARHAEADIGDLSPR